MRESCEKTLIFLFYQSVYQLTQKVLPLPAGPVCSTPCDPVLGAEGVTVATMKGPTPRARLTIHHLGVQEEMGRDVNMYLFK